MHKQTIRGLIERQLLAPIAAQRHYDRLEGS